jgi:hypothetical protein
LAKQTSKQGTDKKINNRGIKMTRNTMHLSILTLNVNGLDVPNKKHRIANWIKKQDPNVYCLQETYLTEKKKTLA